MGLRKRLEDDPYSLTQNELMALQNNDRLNIKLECLLKKCFDQEGVGSGSQLASSGIQPP